MSAIHQVLLAGGAAAYQIPYSLRFRYSNNASLSRTGVVTPTNDKVFTWSGWVKLGLTVQATTDYGELFSGYTASTDAGFGELHFYNGLLRFSGAISVWRATSAIFRDPSAWYHVVLSVDTTQATAANRIKIYINGVEITSFGTSNNPTLNATVGLNNSSTAMRLGLDAPASSGRHFDGYMAEVNFIDGQALTPSSFGQTDSATGVWVAKKYSGTYGSNGFYLKFNDATSTTTIGNDSSGNGNNWTTSGISVTSGVTFDQMLDTPTLNYSVLNPLAKSSVGTLDNANMRWTSANSGTGTSGNGTRVSIGMSTGKWYAECTVLDTVFWAYPGISNESHSTATYNGGDANSWAVASNGQKVTNASASAYGSATWAANDIVNIAYDADNGELYFGKNGTWLNSGNPATRTNPAFTGLSGVQFFTIGFSANTASASQVSFNCGQQPFSYTPPTGFKALNSANLPTPSIKKGSLYMNATLRTGTGATASVSSLGFQPDLVWIKSRSAATDHGLYDAVRGVQKQLESNTTTAETTETTGLTAFNSNGYTVGALAQLNTSAATYVDWAWRETLTAGFDIMTYTGNGVSGRTVSHGLGVTPAMIVVKNRSTAGAFWSVAHKSLTAGYNLLLNDATGQFLPGNAAYGGISAFNSSTFTVVTGLTDQRNVNTNGDSYVAYLWSEIEGFSKFGSYTGNGSTDGPFVFCGFRPRYILVKRTDVANDWCIADSARPAFNPAYNLRANLADIEDTTQYNTDLVSNGFKIRNTTNGMNGSGGTYIFAAYAENPFKYARAR